MAVVDFSWVDPASPDYGKGYWLRAQVIGWADDSFPGFVWIEFLDIDGKPVRFTEKVPVITADSSTVHFATDFPVDLLIRLRLATEEHIKPGEPVTVELGGTDDATVVSPYQIVKN